MARIDLQGAGSAQDHSESRQTIAADSGSSISLPGNDYVTNAELIREGGDLVLRAPDGAEIVIADYFTADTPPILTSPEGASLTPALVQSFAHDAGPVRYAAADSAADESPVGQVEDVQGHATVTRTDGTKEALSEGMPIHEGDIIETGADGAVNIVFVDETSFAVSRNAKLAIDQYVYDPGTESGETNFSVLRGLFVFTSGLIGRDDPDDVKIETPMGSIGIRGTIVAGDADAGTVTVVEGAIVVRALGGQEVTLATQFESARFTAQGADVERIDTQTAQTLSGNFGTLSGVLPTFFNTLDGTITAPDSGETGGTEGTDGTPVQAAPDAVDGKPAQDGQPETMLDPGQTAPNEATAPVLTPPLPPPPAFLQGMDFVPVFMPQPGILEGAGILPPPPGIFPPPPEAGLIPLTVQTTSAPAPSAPPPPPLVIELQAGPIPDDVNANDVIASVKTSFPFGDVLFSLTTAGPFQLVKTGPDRAIIVYTGGGSLTLGDSFGFTIHARLPDGRETIRSFTETVVQPFENELDVGASGASGVHLIGSGNGSGVSLARLGDTDGDGFREVAFIDQAGGTGQVKTLEWIGSSFTPLYTLNTGVGGPTPAIYENMTLAGLGDVNGDGKADYAVGSPASDPGSSPYAGGFTIYSGTNPGSIQTTLNAGSTVVNGSENYGHALQAAGDVNNDGLADVLISAPFEDGSAAFSGVAYLLFGNSGFFAGGSIDPVNVGSTVPGLVIQGLASTDRLGESVSAAGDFNDDGINDFVIGAPGANGQGEAYILFGQTGTSWSGYNLSTAGNYLKITGTSLAAGSDLGGAVTGLGDFNGDGKSDILIVATEDSNSGDGRAYIVYGGLGTGTLDVSTLNGTNGFTIDGTNGDGLRILGGGSVGDFNGDGRSDFALIFGDGAGVNDIYVVYGRSSMPSSLGLQDLEDPTFAFKLVWDGQTGESIEITAAGDITGDGRDDFLIGSDQADFGNGETYLVEGRTAAGSPPTLHLTAPGNLIATATGQSLIGSDGADVLGNGAFGGTSLRAGGGNDMLNATNGGLRLADGGAGNDTLSLVTNSMVLDFSRTGSAQIAEIERLRFMGTGQTLRLGIEDVFQLLHDSADGKLRIFNNAGASASTFQIDDNAGGSGTLSTALSALGFSVGTPGSYGDAGVTYNAYTHGTYTLLVDQSIANTAVI